MATDEPDWERCGQDGCIGVRLPATTLCLAHAAEQMPDAFDAELKRIGAEGTVDARGVSISSELLQRLLAAVPHEADRPAFRAARFTRARFQGRIGFTKASFLGMAEFDEAVFEVGAGFSGSSFDSMADFGEAQFHRGVWFEGSTFQGKAEFRGARVQGNANFAAARFQDRAEFGRSRFQGETDFGEANFLYEGARLCRHPFSRTLSGRCAWSAPAA